MNQRHVPEFDAAGLDGIACTECLVHGAENLPAKRSRRSCKTGSPSPINDPRLDCFDLADEVLVAFLRKGLRNTLSGTFRFRARILGGAGNRTSRDSSRRADQPRRRSDAGSVPRSSPEAPLSMWPRRDVDAGHRLPEAVRPMPGAWSRRRSLCHARVPFAGEFPTIMLVGQDPTVTSRRAGCVLELDREGSLLRRRSGRDL